MHAGNDEATHSGRHRVRTPKLMLLFVIGLTLAASTVLSAASAAPAPNAASAAPASKSGSGFSTLNITIGAPVPYYSAVWIALKNDLFTKNKLKLNILTYSGIATGAAQLVSGQSDIAVSASSQAVSMRVRDQPVKIIFSLANWDHTVTALVARGNIESIADLRARGEDCSIATLPPGGGLYGVAVAIKKVYGIKCRLVFFGSDAAMVAGYLSGATDAVTPNALDAYKLNVENKGNVILNPYTMKRSEGLKLVPTPFPFWSLAGLDERLKSKRVAVKRLIQALREANALMEKMTPAQLAAATASWKPAFAGRDVKDLQRTWVLLKPNVPKGATAGRISTTDWKNARNMFAFWEVASFRVSDPNVSYGAMVDMSYFDGTKTVPLCKVGQRPTAARVCRPR